MAENSIPRLVAEFIQTHLDVRAYSGPPSDLGSQDPRFPAATSEAWAVEVNGHTRLVLRNEVNVQGCRHCALGTSAE